MKNKEWKAGLGMLMIVGLTMYFYGEFNSEPLDNIESLDIVVSHFEDIVLENQQYNIEADTVINAILVDSSETELTVKVAALDAKTDLDNGLVRIFIPGGLVSQENPNRRIMKSRYNIDFVDQGCIQFYSAEKLSSYNKVVFAYLNNRYGKRWNYFLTVETY